MNPGNATPAVQLHAVRFSYPGTETAALSGIDFSVSTGEFVVIMGRSGSGKSSLVQTMNRIIPYYYKGRFTGDVRIMGESISGKSIAQVSKTVGMVFQDFESQLFSTNALLDLVFGPENFGLPVEIIRERLDRLKNLFDLDDLLSTDPSTCSGGQKQRLAVASVMMAAPEVLILDEPVTDLDPLGQKMLYDIMQRIKGEKQTVLLIDHASDFALTADRVVLMADGTLVATDTPANMFRRFELLKQCGVQPPQIMEFFHRLGMEPCTSDPLSAAEILKSEKQLPSETRYTRILEEEKRVAAGKPVICAKNIHFAYDREEILRGVDLSIYEGEFVALIGPNGSGKTTLAKHFNGLLHANSGTVEVVGTPIRSMDSITLAKTIGYVFQNPDHQIFCPTVQDELSFGLKNLGVDDSEIGPRIQNALITVGLTGKEDADPFILTKGDRQRIAVAGILAIAPRILILDEPTTGLDYPDQLRMMSLLKRLNMQGHTIIMVTHSMPMTLQFASRAVVMHAGRILADGPVRDVFADGSVLNQAHLELPPIAELSLAFQMLARSPDEFAGLFQPKG